MGSGRQASTSSFVSQVLLCALIAGSVLLAVGVAVAGRLTAHSDWLTASNTHYEPSAFTVRAAPNATRCRPRQFVPARTRFVVVGAYSSPAVPGRVTADLLDTHGRRLASGAVTVPRMLGPIGVGLDRTVPVDVSDATVCVRYVGTDRVAFASSWSPVSLPARMAYNQPHEPVLDDYRLDFARERPVSPLGQVEAVGRRASLFRPVLYGAWTVWAVLGVALVLGLLAVAATVRAMARQRCQAGPARRPPGRTCRRWTGGRVLASVPAVVPWCAVLATANAIAWGMVQPPFQGPDEPSHIAYTEAMAVGKLPRPQGTPFASGRESFPPAELALLHRMPLNTEAKPSWNPADGALARAEAARARADNGRTPDYITINPPLYYATAGVLAAATSWMNELDRMALLRVMSAVLVGAAVAFWLMFVVEVLPDARWAWVPAGVVLACLPVLGSLGGAVTPDTLLFAISAGFLWILARAWRRGLTSARAVALAVLAAAGMLTKPAMTGLLPGAGVGLVLLVLATRPRRAALVSVFAAVTIFVAIEGGWLWLSSHAFSRGLNGSAGGLLASASARSFSLSAQLTYLWEYLVPWDPPITGHHWFGPPGSRAWPFLDIYVKGFVGRFGWFQYGFPNWVSETGAVMLACLSALAVAALVRARHSVRARIGELVTFTALALGLYIVVGIAGYRYHVNTGGELEETRYLFPLLGFFASLVVLALRALGSRLGPLLGAACSALAVGWSASALLLTLGRFYT